MTDKTLVFTPLRLALMVTIAIANILAVISILATNYPWAHALGVFAVVFIMLFVFVILLELVWLHHRSKVIENPVVRAKYRKAKWIYSVFFVIGFLITLWVLM